MAQLGSFDANSVGERQDYSAVPAGRYRIMATSSDMKPTKNGAGNYLQIEYDIQAGEHQGRKLFERLNLDNPNQTAVDIAYRTLGEICKAVGKLQITDSMELHNIAMECDVAVEEGQPYTKDGVQKEGKPQNVIKRYYKIGEAPKQAQQAGAAAPTTTTQATATKATPPWKR